MEQWELIARAQIHETLNRYNYFGDRGRAADLAQQFTEDGVLETREGRGGRGRDGITQFIEGGTSRPTDAGAPRSERPLVRHHLSNTVFLELTPERASTASYFLRLHRSWPFHWGVYRDVLVPVGDRWLIAHRMVSVDGEMRPPTE